MGGERKEKEYPVLINGETVKKYPGVFQKRGEVDDAVSAPFSMKEMNRAINRTKMTSPGGDDMCYIMLKFMGENALGRLLRIYNRVWEEGQLSKSWKEAVVVQEKSKLGNQEKIQQNLKIIDQLH